ncbi:MAG: prepilin-type N-terminal cleavage/methylation domain-containing protein [Syntrophales bacterium]
MLKKILEKFRRTLKEKGYTLIEVTAVLAVTSVLAAVVIPIAVDKIKKGGETGALEDCKYIAASIASFYADTGVWPARSATTESYYQVLRSGPTNDTTTDPNAWGTGVQITWDNMTVVDHAENHIVADNPGGTLGAAPNNFYRTNLTLSQVDWKGPYVERMRRVDPWGKNYLVYVEGMHTATLHSSIPASGWVLSAGPNGMVETKTSDAAPGGDDIGVIVYRKR